MEAQLQALKVVDLKKLLQDAMLPASGTKAELIKRLLENPSATASLGGQAEEEEDLLAEPSNGTSAAATAPAAAPATAVAGNGVAEQAGSSAPETAKLSAADATSSSAEAGVDQEARKAEVIAELEKRKARAVKFGLPTDELVAKIERIQKFGLNDESGVSMAKLDGELRGSKERKGGKAAKEAEAATAKTEQKQKAAAAPAPVQLDPVEEEKKRKRAERFGLPPSSENKVKA